MSTIRIRLQATILFGLVLLQGSLIYAETDTTKHDSIVACLKSQSKIFGSSPKSPRLSGVDCSALSIKKVNSRANIARDAGFTHNVPKLRKFHKLDGANIKVGVWDAGRVLSNHEQLKNRVTIGDSNQLLHEHATHVAGIIGSDGSSNNKSEGMAKKSKIISYSWDDDIHELSRASSNNIFVTNHSYGVPLGWEYDVRHGCSKRWLWMGNDSLKVDANFGKYNAESINFDELVNKNPNLSIFVAAGNERNWTGNPHNNKTPGTDEYFDGTYCLPDGRNGWAVSNKYKKSDLHNGGGFDTLGGKSLSKNVITIGAAKDLPRKFKNKAIEVTNFTSMGPPDDGRVKPDLIANGDKLLSTYLPSRCEVMEGKAACTEQQLQANELSTVVSSSGTSMATPVAAGIGVLLNQLALKTTTIKRPLRAHELKAALIHTAMSPTNDGAPTYKYGWGLINASSAGNLIAGGSGTLKTIELKKRDKTFRKKIIWNQRLGSATITIVWTDKEGKVNQGLNNRTKNIINKIPFYIQSPSKKYYPWLLNPDKPDLKATKNINVVDNVIKFNIHKSKFEKEDWYLIGDLRYLKSDQLEVSIANNKALKIVF